jgi:hypothetical protein
MAVYAPIMSAAPCPVLPGRSPLLPLSVDRRPLSLADALAQHARVSATVRTLERTMRHNDDPALERIFDACVGEAMTLADRIAATPAASLAELAAKIKAIIADGDWSDHAPLVLADVRRLGGVS